MHDISFILNQHDIDLIRFCIAKESFDAASYFLDRSYIPELITPKQRDDLTVLRIELADAISRSKQ